MKVSRLDSESSISAVVREVIGSADTVRLRHWFVRRENYVIALVEMVRPSSRLVVKLEIPGERPNRRLDSMAAIARMIRAHTPAPTFDIVAVDTSRRNWPWEYFIVTEVPGTMWSELYPQLDASSRLFAQRQIGRAAANLHSLRFDGYGAIGADGAVENGTTPVVALKRRTEQRLRTPRYRDIMLELFESNSARFEKLPMATLCHEDMNPYNLVFTMTDGKPQLSRIPDFESAWASTGESDLARLELWRLTSGQALLEGYAEVAQPVEAYQARRPILQLLWYLEYAEYHPTPDHEAITDDVCRAVGLGPINFWTRARA